MWWKLSEADYNAFRRVIELLADYQEQERLAGTIGENFPLYADDVEDIADDLRVLAASAIIR